MLENISYLQLPVASRRPFQAYWLIIRQVAVLDGQHNTIAGPVLYNSESFSDATAADSANGRENLKGFYGNYEFDLHRSNGDVLVDSGPDFVTSLTPVASLALGYTAAKMGVTKWMIDLIKVLYYLYNIHHNTKSNIINDNYENY